MEGHSNGNNILADSEERKIIEKVLRDILSKYISLEKPIEEVQVDDELEKIGVDSISFMKMVVAIELAYDFEFEDEDLIVDNFQTLDNVIQYISKRTKEAQGAPL